ncbi:ATP-dependent DNA helicase, RecQ family [Prevotella dentalis DSM 3688]|uniref:ATP-dependent DNA helicase RecQ n=1 Tax=Prevotella dentalis (strain ATCC 49559 / DSM 3688 / JCM 13448 / NCTC 12043 / ES 2772) TaxID=908937 RepID=F9D1D9_PREDD|nr:ATP-dependent DNA helicase RecQ [Prevotella dentalis]AGB28156.1 ATP-dependent DNA helicase, RecQ family [Prevotella dentalis DSM 3688]EGQ16301.1 ATP-dependent helicase RecQ [Prevotella dentalis DSM 3688]
MADQYQRILREYWGYDNFRGIQHDIIRSIGAGNDTLGLMPTGGGKSITFQVPALAQEGVCLVVTPLIALMKDQVQHLRTKGIVASAIYSSMSRAEIVKTLENCILGDVKFLYVSPERLSSTIFLEKLKRIRVSFITVDEAHCISQWGYDFRPSYLQIADIRRLKPEAPVLALTATATPQVADDIQQRLSFRHPNVFRMSFERRNLAYVVREATDKEAELARILTAVQGSAIVYVRSRRRCKDISALLEQQGLSPTFYHAGLEPATKDERQRLWQQGAKRVIVATNAFGMGIDKPDVRLVVHVDCPDSIEAYFQEAGRAGRDGQTAYAVLLWNNSDRRKLCKRIDDNFPPKDYIRDVYEHLAYYYVIGTGSGGGHTFSFEIDKFCHTYKYFPLTVDAALRLLQSAGLIAYETDPDAAARLMFLLRRNELYRLEETSPDEDAVITAVLRNYGSLFTDYGYIDEALIAQQAGLGRERTYQVLRGLDHKHILSFIPQRKTPFITYLRDRVDRDDVVIPPSVYEDRKTQFTKRIDAMMEYATNDSVCRSRQLLRYFGETGSHDCGACDVCRAVVASSNPQPGTGEAVRLILGLLSDGRRHALAELSRLPLPKARLDEALHQLAAEEQIHVEGACIFI